MSDSYNERLPLYAIFILVLIATSEHISALMPCKIQNILKNNIFVKHFLCLLTMIFFVVITTEPLKDKNLLEIFSKSLVLYFIFLLLIKNDYRVFILVIFLLGILYLITIKKYELLDILKKENDPNQKKNIEKQINTIIYIDNIFFIIILIFIIIGFLIYAQEKRKEYNDKFNYITFLLGKVKCKSLE